MVPWNGPLALAMRVIPLALLCGNAVVLRSSELVPYVHELVTECKQPYSFICNCPCANESISIS